MLGRLRRIYILTMQAGSIAKWYTLVQLARILANFQSPRQIISAWPKTPVQLGAKIAVFMHFDRRGRLSLPALNYIKDFIANGFCVVFVTNSGMLTQTARAELEAICAAVFVRRNRGYDFGAWRDVIETLALPAAGTEELIIVNDSMYGPIWPLHATLQRLNYADADIWGLTDSWQLRYHLQSFFLAFGQAALRAPAFAEFWSSVLPVPSKVFIVKKYEVGFTQAMLKAGLRCKAIWPYEDLLRPVMAQDALDGLIRAERHKPARTDPVLHARKSQINRIRDAAMNHIAMNPTADLWRQLLLAGFPFIKRELLRKNPSEVKDVADWIEVVRDRLQADPEPILLELRAGLKNRTP